MQILLFMTFGPMGSPLHCAALILLFNFTFLFYAQKFNFCLPSVSYRIRCLHKPDTIPNEWSEDSQTTEEPQTTCSLKFLLLLFLLNKIIIASKAGRGSERCEEQGEWGNGEWARGNEMNGQWGMMNRCVD